MNLGERLSNRARAIEFSGIRKAYELAAKLVDPIDLSIGQPDHSVPHVVAQAAMRAIESGQNRYTFTAGMPELRRKAQVALRKELGWDADVIITSGVSGGLMVSLLALLDPGDEIIFPDPYFVSYRQLVRMVNGVPIEVPSYPDFGFPAAAVEAAITPKTRAIMINSPGNPTGVVMSDADVRRAAEIAAKHNLALISDEIYSDLSLDGPSPSPAKYAPQHTIVLRGYGKTYGVTGWRLGYLAATGTFVDEITRIQQYTYVCAPSMAQVAMLTALELDVTAIRDEYARKRDLVCEMLSGAFDFVRPGGGFYVFPRVPAAFETGAAFAHAAVEKNVLIIPGNVFSGRDTHFRISFATTDAKLREGCKRLCELARHGPG